MFQPNAVEKIKTHILCSTTFLRKSCRLWSGKVWFSRKGHRRWYNVVHALRAG